ncbi:hypothetical protein MW887_003554 [Aspergillus wentii]|nr:hypothetical protein MW887_003554 [Aspergillus wentii]
MSDTRFKGFLKRALAGEDEGYEAILAPVREIVAVFEYVRHDDVVTRMDDVVFGVYSALQRIEHNTIGDPYYFQQVSEFARTYVSDQIRAIRNAFRETNSPLRESIEREL